MAIYPVGWTPDQPTAVPATRKGSYTAPVDEREADKPKPKSSEKFGEVEQDVKTLYKRLNMQADEMYRKYRWQFAEDVNYPGCYADAKRWDMGGHANTLRNNARKAYHEWVNEIDRDLQKHGMTWITAKDMTMEEYINLLLIVTEEDIRELTKLVGLVMGYAVQMDLYHRIFMKEIDIRFIEPKKTIK